MDLQDNLSKRGGTGTAFHSELRIQNAFPVRLRDSTTSSISSDSSNSNLFCTHDTPIQYPTTLAEYVWKLKRNRSSYNIKWNILNKIRWPKSYQNTCRLGNLENIEIACAQGNSSLILFYFIYLLFMFCILVIYII